MNNINHRRPLPVLMLPKYVSQGPSFGDHDRLLDRLFAMYDRKVQIFQEYERVNSLIHTLNCICRNVSDIVALFPTVTSIVPKSAYGVSAVFNDIVPILRPTKFPPEMKEDYRLAVRTITRANMMGYPEGNNSRDCWEARFGGRHGGTFPWSRFSPGYASII
jgi:hypothetical protein